MNRRPHYDMRFWGQNLETIASFFKDLFFNTKTIYFYPNKIKEIIENANKKLDSMTFQEKSSFFLNSINELKESQDKSLKILQECHGSFIVTHFNFIPSFYVKLQIDMSVFLKSDDRDPFNLQEIVENNWHCLEKFFLALQSVQNDYLLFNAQITALLEELFEIFENKIQPKRSEFLEFYSPAFIPTEYTIFQTEKNKLFANQAANQELFNLTIEENTGKWANLKNEMIQNFLS